MKLTWDAKVVVEQVVSCVQSKSPPSQLIIGSDAKFALAAMRHLPVWLQDILMNNQLCSMKPVKMTKGNI